MGFPTARWRRVAQAYPCDDCDAAPTQPCTSRNGRPCTTPHSNRTDKASANGWRDPEEQPCLASSTE